MARKKPPSPPNRPAAAADPPVAEIVAPEPRTESALPFPVVCAGASAGGIDALSRMLRSVPADTGMAFVLIQHLDPTYDSKLAEILGRETSMPVIQVEDHMPVQPDHVYVIPPGRSLLLGHGALQLGPRTVARGLQRPIDQFMRSLAAEQGHLAIGVVLSGTATDGTAGLEEIKAAGGVSFAQDTTAEHEGMPRSAVASGCVDFVLPPEEIGREIGRISRHPYVVGGEPELGKPDRHHPAMAHVLELLRNATGIDFTNYKINTLHRRITRRVALQKLASLHEYARFLEARPAEIDALYQDILINVTNFFRNPDAFAVLKTKVFPKLTEQKARQEPVRVWTLGCSTGEEAYSIAMAYTEYAHAAGCTVPLQVFATDLNATSIEKARAGIYSKGIVQDVSPERLRRFFREHEGGFRISKPIRDMCVFARQNVLADPPFSRMDLVVCRNLLIYLDSVLQQKLLPVLHYALNDNGFLWLGSSETIGSYRDLFDLQDAKHKIYVRKRGTARAAVPVPQKQRPAGRTPAVGAERAREIPVVTDPAREADRLMLARYAPAGVVVDANFEILQFRGDTSPYLAPAQGRASLHLLKMLKDGLLVAVRGALHKAKREQVQVRTDGLRLKSEGGARDVSVLVVPVKPVGAADPSYLVVFEESSASVTRRAARETEWSREDVKRISKEPARREVERLRQELAATREYLQAVIEQQEAANEELQSANEEVQSANEELQSINEELETSKEEIQSSNEELATVNEELQNRNAELSQSNNDLTNLIASVQMAIVMLGPDLRIRRFSPAAEKLLNLIPTDIGRPLTDIKLNLGIDDLDERLVEVIDTVTVHEREIQDKNGRWHLLRMRPYRTLENKIDGAVLVLVDVDTLKRAEQEAKESEARFELLADSAPVLIWVNGLEGRDFANQAYLEFLGVEEPQVRHHEWQNFLHPDDRERYLVTYATAAAQRTGFATQVRIRRADGQYRWMKSVATPRFVHGEFQGFVGCSVDITDFKEAEAVLRQSDRRKDEFLALVSHELRNPLAALRNASAVLVGASDGIDANLREVISVLHRQTAIMSRMVDDLLDVSAIIHGRVQLRREVLDLASLVRAAGNAAQRGCTEHAQTLIVSVPDHPVHVMGDAGRLDQVLGNLLGNAGKFTRAGGPIRAPATA
jgi:two-component system, chemotaxis family, CheB/CheR fusion protein